MPKPYCKQTKNYRMVRDKFQIIGRKKNVEVVLYLISFLAHQFVIIGKRKYPNYKYECIRKYGITPKTLAMYMKSFLYGSSLVWAINLLP